MSLPLPDSPRAVTTGEGGPRARPRPRALLGFRGIARTFADALRGTRRDYTVDSVWHALVMLAIPMVLEMAMESVFAVVDVYWVASFGPAAVAAVGLTESVLSLLYAVAMGLGMGAMALVARRTGEKDADGAGRTAVAAVGLALGAAVPFALVGLLFSGEVLALMGADAATRTIGQGYAAWTLGSSAVVVLLFVLNAVFRGAGDAAIAMRVLWLANGLNLVLDPALIFGWGPFPKLGVTGAAVATVLGRSVAVSVQLVVLFRGAQQLRVLRSHLRVQTRTLRALLATSVGGIAQFAIGTTSWVFLVRIVATFGADALAGYTIAVRIFLFTLLPAWGLASAAATLVGQNLGADKPARAERSVWIAGVVSMAVLALVAVVYIAFDESLVSLFTSVPAVVASGTDALRVMAYSLVVVAWAMTIPQAFNGAGDTRTPTWINLGCFWLLQIPLAYGLAVGLDLGPKGVVWSLAVSQLAAALAAVALFRRGSWMKARV